MTRPLLLALVLSASALGTSGCMSAELARVHRDVETEIPGLQGGHAFQMGRLTMALGRAFVDDEVSAGVLRSVHGVAIGTYALRRSPDPEALVLPGLAERLGQRGWAPFVISREDGEAAFLYTRTRGDELRDLLVITFEAGEMTLVRVSGRFDEDALAAMVHDEGLLADVGPALRHAWPEGATGG